MDHFTAIENAWLEPPQSLAEAVYRAVNCVMRLFTPVICISSWMGSLFV